MAKMAEKSQENQNGQVAKRTKIAKKKWPD